jgi:hypothetical protein
VGRGGEGRAGLPSLIPGARTLDNESKRITRPSVSRLRNEGINLDKSSFPVRGMVDFVVSVLVSWV